MKIDQQLYCRHISEADFQTGVDKGMWGIVDDAPAYANWPYAVMWVKAAEKQAKPGRYYVRFNLDSYPSAGPAATFWDIEKEMRLTNDLWPKGNANIALAFNSGYPMGFYVPCDRTFQPGHEAWKTTAPEYWWTPTFKITIYLQLIHQLLNSAGYANH